MARFRLPFLAGLIASFALPSRADLHAQHVWTRADSSPDARIEHALAFDGARGVVVMHGGRSLDGLLADTWEWDGNNWTQVPTRSGPAALSGHALGYDPLSRRLLLVNGTRTTWIWSGADWTAQSTSSVSGTGGRMSFDLNRNALVHATHAGLFEWTGSDWNKIGSGPGWGRFAYDSRRARHVCVRQAPPPFGTEVLEWSGSAWIRVWRGSLFQSPSQRSGFDVVYDAGRGRVLYLQGVDGSQSVVRLTWEWDGTSWQSGELFDEVIQGYRAVWDAKRSEVLVTGGERYAIPLGVLTEIAPCTYAIRNGKHVVLRATGPWPVRDAASFFDRSRGELVVFGGNTVASPSSQGTRIWDGTQWREVQGASPSASPRAEAATYESTHGTGFYYDGHPSTGGTWVYRSGWQKRSPTLHPGDLRGHGLAHDSRRGVTVLFGGEDANLQLRQDVWEWDGTRWNQPFVPGPAPSPRHHAMLGFDPVSRSILLFGGQDASGALRDTWSFDGRFWQQRSSSLNPPAEAGALMHDEARERVVLVTRSGQVWDWNGAQWTRIAASGLPARLGGATFAYSTQDAAVLRYGGQDSNTVRGDLWALRPVHPARALSFGLACGGAHQSSLSASLPWNDSSMLFELSAQTPVSGALLFVGLSDRQWGPVPLPVGLGGLGMPGCQLLTEPLLMLPMLAQGGTWFVRLPGFPVGVQAGTRFFAQGLAVSPAANSAALITSNGRALEVGARY